MAGNTVTLEFAGDSDKLVKASQRASDAVTKFGKDAENSGDKLVKASKDSADFTDRLGKLGAGISGVTDGFDAAAQGAQALADAQQQGAERASRLARAANDVAQAQEDMAQATRDASQAQIDGKQAAVDEEQARIDQATALKAYNEAVRKNGADSLEARQAQVDLKQAGLDVQQAQEDAAQALRDGSQAAIDAKGAQNDLNDAQREANPTDIQKWAEDVQMFAPILSGLAAVMGLVTVAQWAWNAAQLASPTTWIILAIVALIAVIVLIATKTTWFQDIWNTAWGGIKDAASAVGSWFKDTLWGKWIKGSWEAITNAGAKVLDWFKDMPAKLKSAFSSLAGIITAPFRAGFNAIATAWNNTVGRLSWTLPNWIPGIGGNTISAPQLPHFHSGGVVGGPAGSEMVAVLQAGERVIPATGADAAGTTIIEIRSGGSLMDDAMVELMSRAIRNVGGNVQLAAGGRNGSR